jgi:hypothetical protein
MVSLAAPAARPEPIDSGPQRSKDQNLLAGRVPLAGAEGQPPRLDDASRIAKPPERGNVAPDDQRPIYVVVGIIVLAAVFWWNRRQRDRFDVEDGGSEAAPARRDDDDADDLHAAARGEAQSPDDKIDKTPSKSRPKSS